MEAQLKKSERIEVRVSETEKKLFIHAQRISGITSISAFITRVVTKSANEIIEQNQKILSTEKDKQVFFDSIFSNAKPNKALRDAAKNYKSKNLS